MNNPNISKYKNLIVYYFTGTGNALKAGEWLVEKAREYGISTLLHSIDRFKDIEKPVSDNKTLIEQNLVYVTIGVISFVGLLLALYYWWQKKQAITE